MSIDAGEIDFVRVLGPVQIVTTSGRLVELGSASQRRLVALLAAEAPQSFRVDLICDMLEISPSALRTTVSRVRKALGEGTIAGAQGRYRLAARTDGALFTSALSAAVGSDDRIGTLERALALWTGPPFDEFSSDGWARSEVHRLGELHASAVEDHATELIAARRWAEAIAELQVHVSDHPLRDRARGLLIRSLTGAGRQSDALGAFREYGAYLADTVGTEPSAEVSRLGRLVASGWDGVKATGAEQPADSPRAAGRASSWLPLPTELARGPALIGRGRELARLASDLALVSGAGSRTAVVEGEAGIGKTTLLGAFARTIREHGSAAVLYGRCQEGAAVPWEPFRAPLEHLVEHAPVDLLQAHASRTGGHLGRIAPRLAGRVDVPGTAVSNDVTERHPLFAAVADMIGRVAAIGPVVILLDDLQWAEPTALDLLRHLGRALADVPILWVLSARDTEERSSTALRTAVADLERRPSRRMPLGGFDEDELADLVASLVAVDGRAVNSGVSARLRHQTAGNPLYAVQLVGHWAESGRLLLDAQVALAADETSDEIPASLRNLLWSRVQALGDDVMEVLSAAAVLGAEFDEDVVIDMVEISARDAMDALDVAERARLVVDIGTADRTMQFVHVLVAGAVYSELPGRRRRRLHIQAARVLEQRSAPLATQLARHCALGGLVAEAARWARLAGDHAADQLSASEAARWYRTALDHTATLELADRERADLLVRLGRAEHQINHAGAVATLTEAAALGRRCGAPTIVVQAALATDRGFLRLGPIPRAHIAIIESALEVVDDDAATRARLTALLAEALISDAAGPRRLELAREAVALADAGSDPALLARICSSVLYALWGPSPEATRLRADVARRSIVAAQSAGDLHLEFGVHAAAYTVAIQLADPVAAVRSLERLHAIADEIGTPQMVFTMAYYGAFVAAMEARFEDAAALMREGGEVAAAMGAADAFAVFAGQAAVIATIAGHHAELPPVVARAIEAGPARPSAHLAHAIVSMANGPKKVASDLLDVGMANGFRAVPADVMWMTSMLGYAILAIELQDLDAAAHLLAIIEPYRGEVATSLGPVAAYAGRLASVLGRHELAEQHLNAALGIVNTFGWDYHRATTLIFLAGIRRRRLGRLDGTAHAALDEAARICSAHRLSRLLDTIGEIRG